MNGLRTVIYKVDDLNIAKKWYSDVFETSPYFDEPFYVGFNIGGYELGLLPDDRAKASKSDNVLTYWGVDDIHSMYKRFLDHGAYDHRAPENVGGAIMTATVLDPWDNVVGLIYNPEFKIEDSEG